MHPFRLHLPTAIEFGWGKASNLAPFAHPLGSTFLVVHGRSFLRTTGRWETIVAPLSDDSHRVLSLPDVPPEPSVAWVDAARQRIVDEGVDGVIGVGGGSVLDVAKAAAGLARGNQPTQTYHEGHPLPQERVPCIAVPTTAGTGAEVTPNAVLTGADGSFKKSIRGQGLLPVLAVVDPETTVSLAAKETAYSGLDALCQGIESFTSIHANPPTKALSLCAIESVWFHLRRAWEQGTDSEARTALSLGATVAGIALAHARLGAVHGLAHPLGARFAIPHGLCCGVLLPPVIAVNLETEANRYVPVADAMNLPSPEALPAALTEWMQGMNVPTRLRDLGVDKNAFGLLCEEALPSGSLQANPRPMNPDLLREILDRAW